MVERGIKSKHPMSNKLPRKEQKAELGNLAGIEFCGKRFESDGWFHFFFVYYYLGVVFVAISISPIYIGALIQGFFIKTSIVLLCKWY